MTSRHGGGHGGGGGDERPPSSPSSGSEENGFVHRPRVAGLYADLSREELDRVSEEGIYGPNGDPNERREASGSQRSLNLPSIGTGGHPRPQRISRTPQPPRRSARGSSTGRCEKPRSSSPGGHLGRLRHPEDVSRTSLPSLNSQPHSRDFRSEGVGLTAARRPTDFGSSSSIVNAQLRREPSKETVKRSPPPYAGLSPPEYEYRDTLSPLFPRCGSRSYADSRFYELVRPDDIPDFIPYETGGELRPDSSQSTRQDNHFLSPPETTSNTPLPLAQEKSSPVHESSDEVSPGKRTTAKPQDGTRLRPPLSGTAGTSADSGTGDTGSVEIQPDTAASNSQTASQFPDNLSVRNSTVEKKSPGGAAGKGTGTGKQTVKPFTKESLDRLENRTVQLVREYGFQPRRKTSVEDGAVLPHKFEPFPADLYGRPLEEIDNFIYDEVSSTSTNYESYPSALAL